jgi:DUF3071 family protein
MGELELVGLHDDGEHLVLVAQDGQQFRLRIDETLRAAVRRDRPQLEKLRAERTSVLSPREIQMRIRAGASAEEVSDECGVPVEHVRRYEGPVIAEREFIVDQARATRVGRDAGAPVLGDLVTDRLAARGVDTETLVWDAYRDQSGPWTVAVAFTVAEVDVTARWTFDTQARSVHALEDEARWLSETEIADEPIQRRHLEAVRDVVFDVQSDGVLRPVRSTVDDEPPAPDEPEPADPTATLLDDLRFKRGIRQQVEYEDEGDEFEGFGPQHAFDFSQLEAQVPGAHPVDADPDASARILGLVDAPAASPPLPDDTRPPASDEPVAETPAPLAERPRAGRKGRASVPSWDEIVFGAKPE